MPTTAIGKIFKPALTLKELESVVRDEARSLQVELDICEAAQDPRQGAMVRWRAANGSDALSARLAHYTFKQEQVI